MRKQLSLAPHDDITYLSALARLLDLDLAHLASTVEIEYTSPDTTQPAWFAAVRADKAALIRKELATVAEHAAASPGLCAVLAAGLDPQTLATRGVEPLASVLECILKAADELLDRYEGEGCPLPATKAVLAALARCMVATRRVEPVRVTRALTKIHVHLMLLVGQYELTPATA